MSSYEDNKIVLVSKLVDKIIDEVELKHWAEADRLIKTLALIQSHPEQGEPND